MASRESTLASEQAGLVVELLVRAGDRVKSGDPLVRLRQKPFQLQLQAARGELEEGEARSQSAEIRLERLRSLSSSQVVSEENVDDALYAYQAAIAKVSRLKAEVLRLRDALDRTTVRAPFAGAIVAEYAQAGEWLDAGDPVVELMALDGLEVQVEIPESYFASVRAGLNAVVVSNHQASERFAGSVRAVVPRALVGARTFTAFIHFPREKPLALGVGASVGIELKLRKLKKRAALDFFRGDYPRLTNVAQKPEPSKS